MDVRYGRVWGRGMGSVKGSEVRHHHDRAMIKRKGGRGERRGKGKGKGEGDKGKVIWGKDLLGRFTYKRAKHNFKQNRSRILMRNALVSMGSTAFPYPSLKKLLTRGAGRREEEKKVGVGQCVGDDLINLGPGFQQPLS